MPPLPKFNKLDAIWTLKIIHQIESHRFGTTQSNIRITRKIAEYLKVKENVAIGLNPIERSIADYIKTGSVKVARLSAITPF